MTSGAPLRVGSDHRRAIGSVMGRTPALCRIRPREHSLGGSHWLSGADARRAARRRYTESEDVRSVPELRDRA
jgi:hypothetical protein